LPVEAKPIVRPDVICVPVLGFSLPESVIQRRPKLEKSAEIIAGLLRVQGPESGALGWRSGA
jgi:hypothetical protein